MDVTKAMGQLAEHVQKYGDNKYQRSIIDTENSLREPKFTILTAEKYLARYLAHDGEKRANPQDLLKAAHFILFEVQNRINQPALSGVMEVIKVQQKNYKKIENK